MSLWFIIAQSTLENIGSSSIKTLDQPPFKFFGSTFLERKVEKNKEKVTKYGKWGLYLFVAIPLPGTGAWTGALIASFLNFKNKDSFIAIAGGVVTAGVIMTAISYLPRLIF